MQKPLTSYSAKRGGEKDEACSIVYTLNEEEKGVRWTISKQGGEENLGDVKVKYEETMTLEGLDGENLVTVMDVFDDWLDSDSRASFKDTLHNIEGVYKKQRLSSGLGGVPEPNTKEFDSLRLSVGERAINLDFWDGEKWLGLEIPSAESRTRGRVEDFQNIATTRDVFYDFFDKRFTGELPDEKVDSRPAVEQTSINKVKHIFNRFREIHRQLSERSHGRDPIKIQDEYDVQYLLHSLLKLHFDDVRDESYLKEHAGKSPRIDFLIEGEKIGIETKITGNRSTEKIRKELAEDKEQYRSDAHCETLLCFIYDPDRQLENPTAFEKDLSETTQNLTTHVTVTQ